MLSVLVSLLAIAESMQKSFSENLFLIFNSKFLLEANNDRLGFIGSI
jgi:hypothetical protein